MKGFDLDQFRARVGRIAAPAGSMYGAVEGTKAQKKRKGWRTALLLGLAAFILLAVVAVLTQGRGSYLPSVAGTRLSTSNENVPAAPTAAASAPQYNSTASSSTGSGKAADQAPAASSGASGTTNTTAAQWDRMLIRTASLQLTVTDVGTGVDKVIGLATLHGGHVVQMDSHLSGDYTISSVTIQVPTEEFDKILPELQKLDGQVKKVVSENVSSQDVTDEYTDLQSQLRNLQATEARMLALQQKADKLDDILTLDRELRQVQGEIEQITGRTNYLSKSSAMSQITVGLQPAGVPGAENPPQPAEGWDPGAIAAQAWNASLDLLSKMATVLITIVVFLWWAVPLALVAWLFFRRSVRRQAPVTPISGTPEGSA